MEKSLNSDPMPEPMTEEELDAMLERITLDPPRSAYKIFVAEAMKTDYPNRKVVHVIKEIARRWQEMTKEEKEVYEQKHLEEKTALDVNLKWVETYLMPRYNKKGATAEEMFISLKVKESKLKGRDDGCLLTGAKEEWDKLIPDERLRWEKMRRDNDAWWERTKEYSPLSTFDFFSRKKLLQAKQLNMELTEADCKMLFSRLSEKKLEKYKREAEEENERRLSEKAMLTQESEKPQKTHSYYEIFIKDYSAKKKSEANRDRGGAKGKKSRSKSREKGKTNFFKEASNYWKSLPDEEKKVFHAKAKREKVINAYRMLKLDEAEQIQDEKKERKAKRSTSIGSQSIQDIFNQVHKDDPIPNGMGLDEYLKTSWANLIKPIYIGKDHSNNWHEEQKITIEPPLRKQPFDKKKPQGFKQFYKKQIEILTKDNPNAIIDDGMQMKVEREWSNLEESAQRKYALVQKDSEKKIKLLEVTTPKRQSKKKSISYSDSKEETNYKERNDISLFI